MDASKHAKNLLRCGFCVVPFGYLAAEPAITRMLDATPGLVEFHSTGDDEPGSHPGFGSCALPTRKEIFKPIVKELIEDNLIVQALGGENTG
jgi:hypothetical protein